MLSSLLRPTRARRRSPDESTFVPRNNDFLSPGSRPRLVRHATADFTESDNDDDDDDENTEDGRHIERDDDDGLDEDYEDDEDNEDDQDEEEGEDEDEDEDGPDEESPLLPIFSHEHLDKLPVYNLAHAIRLIVMPRTETTLSWEQLRSPQVSQFLIKPMQQQIRVSHFTRATLYALMANALQFSKEGHLNPGNTGTSRTRAMVCEILAIKLLKEYNTRELIDALSYDFYPLQGLTIPGGPKSPYRPAAARTSTLEVAIRAQAKHFLAHPVVVQQLEAIWAGMIVFHSNSDNLHRSPPKTTRHSRSYGTTDQLNVPGRSHNGSPDKWPAGLGNLSGAQTARRTVTIYDPRDASLFKLSRLRVPLYRQILSTCSLAILLGLYLAVLSERSYEITTLEIIFWIWSAGFMLDEIVGFNEQGFSLYIMSFWNIFDLGILLLLIIYYCMRLYGLFLVDDGRHDWNDMAYDTMAATSVLLFPRLFSVLDHYRYFSQLLIAFRLMAMDLVAVFILILILCSGFFIAFTLSFGKELYGPAAMAYQMMQILLGFTPAAWDVWSTYNLLGKAILVLYLFISHFLIVTILITVLTNSFLAIASNAHEEHQFLFAVNTISMVKNDALFSYVAPTNVIAWMLAPLRYVLPFRQFIKLNRYVIKLTHFPLLFIIFGYEKLLLARGLVVPTDLVENNTRGSKRMVSFRDPELRAGVFSPSIRLREESVAGFQKDRALDEVFRITPRNQERQKQTLDRRKTSNVVHTWMNQNEGIASPPREQDPSIVDRLERRRMSSRASWLPYRREISVARSVASDPAELLSTHDYVSPYRRPTLSFTSPREDPAQQTDGDGDDELASQDEDERMTFDKHSHDDRSQITGRSVAETPRSRTDYFGLGLNYTPPALNVPIPSSEASSRRVAGTGTTSGRTSPTKSKRLPHNRTLSTNTILYNPVDYAQISSSNSPQKSRPTSRPVSRKQTPAGTGTHTPAMSGYKSPKRPPPATSKPRPIMPKRGLYQSAPNRAGLLSLDSQMNTRNMRTRDVATSLDIDLTSDAGLMDASNAIGAVPSSFATQMAFATGMVKNAGVSDGSERMMARIMLARMKTLEEGFQAVVREVKQIRNSPEEKDGSVDSRRRDAGHQKENQKDGDKLDKGKRVLRRQRGSAGDGDSNTHSGPSTNPSKRNSVVLSPRIEEHGVLPVEFQPPKINQDAAEDETTHASI